MSGIDAKIVNKQYNVALLSDQFCNFKGHIGKNDLWVPVHPDMIEGRLKNFGQFDDISLIDEGRKPFGKIDFLLMHKRKILIFEVVDEIFPQDDQAIVQQAFLSFAANAR